MFGFGKKPKATSKPDWAAANVVHDSRWLTDRAKDNLRQNIAAMPEIPAARRDDIYAVAEVSGANGDLFTLANAIGEIEGVPIKRARIIARILSKKTQAITTADNQMRLGSKKAVWMHSFGPACSPDPAIAAAHVQADGKEYEIAKGMLINGTRTWPGYDDECKCVSRMRVSL